MFKQVAILLSMATVLVSCSFFDRSSSDPEPSGPEVEHSSGPLFEPWPHEFQTQSEDYATILGAATNPDQDSDWFLAGSLTKTGERAQSPYIVPVSAGKQLEGEILPSDGAAVGSAAAIHVDESGLLVGGQVVKDGSSQAVVWTRQEGTWELVELVAEGTQSRVSGISSDGSLVFGWSSIDGDNRPEVWQNVDEAWEAIPVNLDGRDLSDYSITSLERLGDGTIIGVGSFVNGQYTSPLFWTLEGSSLVPSDPGIEGLGRFGSLDDLILDPSGEILIVGGQTSDGFTTPVVYWSTDLNGQWAGGTLEFDIGRSVVGYGIASVLRSGSSLYATFTGSWLQEVIKSDDRGRTWRGTGLTNSGLAEGGAENTVFVASSDSILIGDEAGLFNLENGEWDQLDLDAVPNPNVRTVPTVMVVEGQELQIAGSAITRRDDGTEVPEAKTWSGSISDPWEEGVVSESDTYINDVAANGDGVSFVGNSRADSDGAAKLLRPAESKSLAWVDPTPENDGTVYRRIFTKVVRVDGGTTIIAGSEISSVPELEPEFYIAEADGELVEASLENLSLKGSSVSPACLVVTEDGFVSVLVDDGTGEHQLVTSPDGRKWTGLSSFETLDVFQRVADCDYVNGQLILVGATIDKAPVIAESADLVKWKIANIGLRNDVVSEVLEVDGQRIAVGIKDRDTQKDTGYVWYEKGDKWIGLENGGKPTGLEPDDFAGGTSITQTIEYGDTLVLFGGDRDRVGLWSISKKSLAEALLADE